MRGGGDSRTLSPTVVSEWPITPASYQTLHTGPSGMGRGNRKNQSSAMKIDETVAIGKVR